MKHILQKSWLMLLCLLVGVGSAWAESTVTTYTFNSKSWGATCNGSAANWTGSADGNQYSASNSPIGVQVLASGDGTTVTSPKSFTNVSKVVVNYSSSSKGVGSIKVSVGGTDIDTKSISKSQSKVDLTYTPTTTLSGNVVITCNCTTNSYALVSVSITEESEAGSITPELSIANTQETAYTISEAIDLINAGSSQLANTEVYVKGIVSEIVTPWSDQYNNITYNISADGATTGSQFQLYRCVTNGAEVGANVIACGKLTKHNSTYEFAAGNKIVDIQNPVKKTITSLAVSGTPTKTAYEVGDAFETTGLVITATYSDGTTAPVTEGIEWTVDPETLALGTTSVDVMASVDNVVSEVHTVNGLTVTKPEFEKVTYNFSSFTSGQSVELTDLDGFVITLSKGEGQTNPAWSNNQARIYASGCLTVKANNAIIKSIEYDYTINANKNGVVPTIDNVEGTTTAGTWDADNKTWTGADDEVTFYTSGTAGNIGFTKLIIKYVEKNLIVTSLAWSADEAEVRIGAADNVFPTLTTTPAELEGVTYESSNTGVATIAADGTITLVKEGETTITANYAGDAEHASAAPVSYTLTVVKAPFVPTPVEAGYETVDFAALYSSVTTSATVEDYEGTSFSMAFAKPQSSSTPTKYYENGKAVRAYTGNTITITGAENITYVDIAWAKGYVDDAVSITGIGTKTAVITFSKTCRFTRITVSYNPTFASLDDLIAAERSFDAVNVTINDEIFTTMADSEDNAYAVIFKNKAALSSFGEDLEWKAGGKVTGTLSNVKWIYMGPGEIVGNLVCPSTVWDALEYTAPKEIPTFNSIEELLDANLSTGTTVNVTINGTIKEAKYNDGGGKNYYAVQLEGDFILGAMFVPDYGWKRGGTISGTLENVTYYDEVDEKTGERERGVIGTAGDIFAGLTYVGPQSLTLVAQGADDMYYGTFSSDKVTFFPDDYIVSAVGVESGELYQFDNDEAFEEGSVEINGEDVTGYYVPANTGVLVTSLENTVTYYTVADVTPSNNVEAVNMLRPATAAMEETGYKFYKLAYDDYTNKTALGFYYGAEGGAAFTCKSGSAYLAVPAESSLAKGFALNGGVTNIQSVNKAAQNNVMFNLAGQRILNAKGIVIKNGKKFVK